MLRFRPRFFITTAQGLGTCLALALLLCAAGLAHAADDPVKTIASINIASIVANGVVRVCAIAAGVYIVKLGHDTLIRGVKGEFEFEGHNIKLKGSVPGLLFVLLGSLAIGWALNAVATGKLDAKVPNDTEKTREAETRPSDETPGFLGQTGGS